MASSGSSRDRDPSRPTCPLTSREGRSHEGVRMTARRRRPSLLEDDSLQHVDSDDSDVESEGDICASCDDERSKHPSMRCDTFVEDK